MISALPPKADITCAMRKVWLVPKADIQGAHLMNLCTGIARESRFGEDINKGLTYVKV